MTTLIGISHRKDGRSTLSNNLPILNASGRFVESSALTDITERKRAEEERERLRQAQADLARVNRVTTMGELTASLAHEVNQPIAAAVTNANTCVRWLAGEPPNLEEARAAAMRVVTDGKRAAEIISRMRQLFKKGTPERELVNINEVIREMIVLLRGEATQNIVFMRWTWLKLPRFMGDRVQLQQVMMNLIMNSIDAMKNVDGSGNSPSVRARKTRTFWCPSAIPAWACPGNRRIRFSMRSSPPSFMAPVWDFDQRNHCGIAWRPFVGANNSPRGASFHFCLPQIRSHRNDARGRSHRVRR